MPRARGEGHLYHLKWLLENSKPSAIIYSLPYPCLKTRSEAGFASEGMGQLGTLETIPWIAFGVKSSIGLNSGAPFDFAN